MYGFWIVKNYRESYNLFACNGILFNHESPRRGETFVTRKITIGLNKILKGEADCLVLGNLDAKRDWGHAKDYVRGMWLMMQHDFPEDYVLATSDFHSVREFVEKTFALRGFEIQWRGEGLDEVGYDLVTGRELIFVSERYFRPAEVDFLLGDSSKAEFELGWTPQVTFDQLIQEMVNSDCNYLP
jgi:GDPmannose 4,6-dehydratase